MAKYINKFKDENEYNDKKMSLDYPSINYVESLDETIWQETLPRYLMYYIDYYGNKNGLPYDSGTTVLTSEDISVESNTLTNLYIGEGITEISEYTIQDTRNLVELVFPSTLERLGGANFQSCKNLNSIEFPQGLINLDADFGGFNGTSIDIPSSVTTINGNLFSSSPNLSSATIPDSVTSIYASFNNCDNISSITVGSGVTKIEYIGRSCPNLQSITIKAVNPPTLRSWSDIGTDNTTIYVPQESVETYKNQLQCGAIGLQESKQYQVNKYVYKK